jgi:hypothetical protein
VNRLIRAARFRGWGSSCVHRSVRRRAGALAAVALLLGCGGAVGGTDAFGDITFCNEANVSCADLEAGLGTGYADVLGTALAQIVAQTCDAIPPVG